MQANNEQRLRPTPSTPKKIYIALRLQDYLSFYSVWYGIEFSFSLCCNLMMQSVTCVAITHPAQLTTTDVLILTSSTCSLCRHLQWHWTRRPRPHSGGGHLRPRATGDPGSCRCSWLQPPPVARKLRTRTSVVANNHNQLNVSRQPFETQRGVSRRQRSSLCR